MIGSNSKLYSIVLFGLLGVSVLLYILFILGAVDSGLLLNWGFLLMGIAAIVAVVFAIVGMAKDIKKASRSLISIAVLALIFGIGMGIASDETYKMGESVVASNVSQRSEAGLITFYVMIILAVVAIIYTEISKAFK